MTQNGNEPKLDIELSEDELAAEAISSLESLVDQENVTLEEDSPKLDVELSEDELAAEAISDLEGLVDQENVTLKEDEPKVDIELSDEELLAQTFSSKEGFLNQEKVSQEKVAHEEESKEVDQVAYSEDINENLDEFVKLLDEKRDHIHAHGVEGIRLDEGHLDGHSVENLQLDEGHLDGHNVKDIQLDEHHLDGHDVEDMQPAEGHLDAYSTENIQPSEDEGSIEILLLEGRKHMEMEEFEEAISYFDRVLELDPHHLDAWSAKGDALLGVSENKPTIEKLVIEGKEYLQRKEFEKALICFDRALELDPHHLDAWGLKGDALLEMERSEKG